MSKHTLWDFLPFLLAGIPLTLQVTAMGITLAVSTALVLALGRMSHIRALRWVSGFVIELFRGTSALVQLFWAFYVLPFFGLELSPLVAGVLVLGLNEGSYFAEVVRPALQSVVGGQRDAAITLHLPRWYRFRRIILPQALPVMIPPFGNALIGMLKFTALVSLVTLQDIAFRASMIRSSLGHSGPSLHRDLADLFRPGGDARGVGEGAGALRQPPSRAGGRAIEADDTQERFAGAGVGPFRSMRAGG